MPEIRAKKAYSLQISSIIVGISGITGQLLLLREMLISFHGNELIVGLVIANWLLAEAFGAYLGGIFSRFRHLFLILLFIYPVLLFISVYYTRGITTGLLGLFPGESASMTQILIGSLMMVAPVGMVHGFLYPLACSCLGPYRKEKTAGIVYLYETIGTLAGGTIFSLVLAHRFHSFQICFAILILHLLTVFFILYIDSYKFFLSVLMLILVFFSFNWLAGSLHEKSLRRLWYGKDIVHYENSPYGNITIIKKGEEHTVYYDGQPSMTFPTPDTALIADYVHLALSTHHSPEKIFVSGGGSGGPIFEILKHPVKKLVYAELDPKLPFILKNFPNPLTTAELEDPRVSIHLKDARLFLSRTDKEFDIIFLGFLSPDSLQANRLFTIEFFRLAETRLKKNGIFVFSVPGSHVFMGKELSKLNHSLYHSIKSCFKHIAVIPGEVNIYLASQKHIGLQPDIMYERLAERGVCTGMFRPAYFNYRLDDWRKQTFFESLENTSANLNRDFYPSAFYYALSYWGSAYSPGHERYYAYFENISLLHYIIMVLVLSFALVVFLCLMLGRKRGLLCYSIASSGASGMTVDLMVILIFQGLYGLLYQLAGVLIAIFMAGICIGSTAGIRLAKQKGAIKIFIIMEIVIALLLLFLYIIAVILQKLYGFPIASVLMLYSLIAGSAVGVQFPLAVSLINSSKERARSASVLYAADLMGGWVAGLLISFIFFPVLGLKVTLFLFFLFKLSGIVLLILNKKLWGQSV